MIAQQIKHTVSWGWCRFIHWGMSTAEVIKECLCCTLCSTGIWHCLDHCFGVPTTFLTQVTCYPLCIFSILLLLFSGYRLVLSFNINVLMASICDAPGSHVHIQTPNLWCPSPPVHSPLTLACFLLPMPQAVPYVCFSCFSPQHVL